MANQKIGKAGNIGKVNPSFLIFNFSVLAVGQNSDLKILEKNFRDFRDFPGFLVFDLGGKNGWHWECFSSTFIRYTTRFYVRSHFIPILLNIFINDLFLSNKDIELTNLADDNTIYAARNSVEELIKY